MRSPSGGVHVGAAVHARRAVVIVQYRRHTRTNRNRFAARSAGTEAGGALHHGEARHGLGLLHLQPRADVKYGVAVVGDGEGVGAVMMNVEKRLTREPDVAAVVGSVRNGRMRRQRHHRAVGQSKEDLLQGYLARRVEAYLATKGRKVMGWDELLGCGVDTTATILSWRGAAPGAKGAQQGHDVVMSPTSNCYFDFDQSEDHAIEPTNCYGTLPIEKVYNWNPVPDGLSEAAQRHIIGVQANVWCEYITMDHVLEYMILPRLAALSEVQWMQQDKRSWEGFVARETKLRNLYGIYGWTYAHHMWPDEFRKVAKQY